MRFCPLFSGSSGNALYVEYGETRLLIDAGKNCKTITEAMRDIGADPADLTAILITHEHSDHISGVDVLSRRYHLPVYATRGTWREMAKKTEKLDPASRIEIDRESDFYVGGLCVQPFSIPHDAADPVGYRLFGGGISISTATDIGHMTNRILDTIAGSDLILLESNHDPEMVRRNEHYAGWLKRRILGTRGHLSNEDCAEALVRLVDRGTRNVLLGHLSGENNTPSLARHVSEDRITREGIELGRDLYLDVALRDTVGDVYTLQERP